MSLQIGDRVKARQPNDAITHGVVVLYQGKHNPKKPRIRWHSGWGTTCLPSNLELLTPSEMTALPTPTLCSIDL